MLLSNRNHLIHVFHYTYDCCLSCCTYQQPGICTGLPAETRHVSNEPKIIQIGPEMKEI